MSPLILPPFSFLHLQGLGKTIQAIAILSYYSKEWPALVICPSSLRLTWKAEIIRWLKLEDEVIQVIFHAKDPIEENSQIIICSYDLISKSPLLEALMDLNFNVIVADESHYLKSGTAKRTKVIVPMLIKSKRAILLSGKVIDNERKERIRATLAFSIRLDLLIFPFPWYPPSSIFYNRNARSFSTHRTF